MDSNAPINPPVSALQPVGSGLMVNLPTLTDKDPIGDGQARTAQQNILPTAVQSRFLSQIITTSPITWNYINIPNSSSGKFVFAVNNNQNQQILALPDVTAYVGITDISQISNASEWPTAAIGGGNCPIYINSSDWGLSNGINSITKVVVRNNTGNPLDAVVVVQWRIITQPQSSDAQR